MQTAGQLASAPRGGGSRHCLGAEPDQQFAEVFYLQRNYQSAANEYRESLNGDGEPRWTEVWSHIMLGKIFDITGQRQRAVNEYRQAIQTGDNTQGALDEARKYLEQPYQREREKRNGM